MFYGKECNYAFATSKDDFFDAYFIKDEVKDKDTLIEDLLSDYWNNVDTCILWAGHELFIKSDYKFKWKRIVISNCHSEIEMEFTTQDELVEAMWETLIDVNIDEDECIEQNWFVFPIGTYKEEIWHWFDEHHSKGIAWLINDYESEYRQ